MGAERKSQGGFSTGGGSGSQKPKHAFWGLRARVGRGGWKVLGFKPDNGGRGGRKDKNDWDLFGEKERREVMRGKKGRGGEHQKGIAHKGGLEGGENVLNPQAANTGDFGGGGVGRRKKTKSLTIVRGRGGAEGVRCQCHPS